jgi:hypothetical protein
LPFSNRKLNISACIAIAIAALSVHPSDALSARSPARREPVWPRSLAIDKRRLACCIVYSPRSVGGRDDPCFGFFADFESVGFEPCEACAEPLPRRFNRSK